MKYQRLIVKYGISIIGILLVVASITFFIFPEYCDFLFALIPPLLMIIIMYRQENNKSS